MKFNVDRSELVLGVSTVCKAISSRTTLPVLENIYLRLVDSKMILRGNDLELGIEYQLDVTIIDNQGPTGFLVKSGTLSDIISKLTAPVIEFDLDDRYKCNIKADAIDFDIFGISMDDYPQFPVVEKDVQFELDSSVMLDLIKHTIFSVSYDETKQFLSGIKIESKDQRCDFISTDGFRLSLKYASLDTSLPDFSCIIPYKTMTELSKVLTAVKSETIKINLSERQISFSVGTSLMVSRLINGRFPDYKQVMPKTMLFEYKINRQLLLSAADRANIIASHSNFVARFKFTSNELIISASNSKLGDYVEQLPLTPSLGEGDISISFNIKLMQEALKIIDQQDIVFQINSELSPCVIKPVGDETYTHILMPIRMSEYASSDSSTESKSPQVSSQDAPVSSVT
ncbi:MAG: DNA polymerase III subunit beta [Candidatus Marinamargulisbacteria bacterium]